MRAFLLLTTFAALAAPLEAQYLTIEPDRDSVGLGDVVTLRVEAHLGPQETMASYAPALAKELPEGVRILSLDTLRRNAGRVFVGTVRLAFYRSGLQEVPLFQVVVRHTPTDRGTPYSFNQPIVRVATFVPEGNPPLRDIRDPFAPRGPAPRTVLGALALVLLAAGGLWWSRRRPRRVADVPLVPDAPLDPHAAALASLDAIARDGWPARDPVRAIELAAGVLRGYLGATLPGVAGALTTHEVLARLPATLNGTSAAVRRALDDADLVKFARVRPDAATAEAFVGDVRRTLDALPLASGA